MACTTPPVRAAGKLYRPRVRQVGGVGSGDRLLFHELDAESPAPRSTVTIRSTLHGVRGPPATVAIVVPETASSPWSVR